MPYRVVLYRDPIVYDCDKYRRKYSRVIGERFHEFDPYVFDVDHVAKIRSELSITALEIKKLIKLSLKSGLNFSALFLK